MRVHLHEARATSPRRLGETDEDATDLEDARTSTGSAVKAAVDRVAVPDPTTVVQHARRRRHRHALVYAIVILLVVGAVSLPLLRDDDRVTVAAPWL